MANCNQVSSAGIAANTHATNKEKFVIVKLCKENTLLRIDIVKLGEIYSLLYYLDILIMDIR